MNIATIKGFKAQGVRAGLKTKGNDLAIIYSETPAVAAATFTKNRVIAEPLKLDKKNIKNGVAQAIVVNSGNANACTGRKGYQAAVSMAATVAKALGIKASDVMVASTGIIGREFPIEKTIPAIIECAAKLESSEEAGHNAATAIMTTDTVKKESCVSFTLDGKTVSIAAIAKGSGMIHPNMGTMLSFIVSDLNISQKTLSALFKKAINDSFNMITIDGDTSTNDMAVILCNGAAGNKKISSLSNKNAKIVLAKMSELCIDLARQMVKDGEGVTKFIEYKVIKAKTEKNARDIIHTVADSSLVKCAFFGNDPNWGRILAAAGRAGVSFNPDKVDLSINGFKMLAKGQPLAVDLNKVSQSLKSREIEVIINLNAGKAQAKGWGNDLTLEYVTFNSAYST